MAAFKAGLLRKYQLAVALLWHRITQDGEA